METLHELYSREALSRLRRNNGRWTAAVAALAGAALLACVVLCFCVRTRNASAMLLRIIAVSTLGGWAVIALWLNVVLPGRREAEHEAHMLDGPSEFDEGVVTVSRELLRIPKSARLLLRSCATARASGGSPSARRRQSCCPARRSGCALGSFSAA